ncbi:phage tail tube protein [Sphingobium yanoikuyae]|uniref:phage tail tube protein n=1 Tax=Sphingobium yanoikuyae TaxID=13690 RepID=UPI0028AD0172|nr:phage tail tube protein [Sphingobium yanoikuyae]
MGFGMGINSVLHGSVETGGYGISPASGYRKLPFVSHGMGEEVPLIEDDTLGFGREGVDPIQDAASNDGDITVPVDNVAFGFWLTALLGDPVTTGAGPTYTHVFQSGKSSLYSHSLEIGHPDVPLFSMHYGGAANQMRIGMSKSGLLNATMSLICQGETDPVASSVVGTPTDNKGTRFAQATGLITRDGTPLATVVSADLSISNGFDKLDVMRGDKGRIGGVVPGVFRVALRLTTRLNGTDLLLAASNKTPLNLDSIGWTQGAHSLKFSLPRVFLNRSKKPVQGPNGIMAEFNAIASGAVAKALTATLINGNSVA